MSEIITTTGPKEQLFDEAIQHEGLILISSFLGGLMSDSQFKNALVEQYTGINSAGHFVPESQKKRITVHKNGAAIEVDYDFSDDWQKLHVDIYTPPDKAYRQISAFIETPRVAKPNYPKNSNIQVIGLSDSSDPIIHKNTLDAVKSAKALIAFCKS